MNASKRVHLVRIGGGLVGAAMLAVAAPATTGAGPFGSAAPKPAEAAVSCNDTKVVTKQSGGQKATAKIPVNRGSTNCLLGQGNRQGGVRTLQLALNACYLPYLDHALQLDGAYGPDTQKAVKVVQRRAGIRQDGIYGPQTARAMKWPFGRNASPPVKCEQLGSAS